MAKCKCNHDWQPVFTPATEANSVSVRMSWIMLGRAYKTYRQCAICGATGSVSQGYSRGGGRKMCTHEIDERVWNLANDWNSKLSADNSEVVNA